MAENKFDPKAWQKAYENAGLTPEARRVKGEVEKVAEESGIGGHIMSVDQALEHWKARDENRTNLVHAELGDDTWIELVGEGGREGKRRVDDVAVGGERSFDLIKGVLRAYKAKGDTSSAEMVLSVFPEGSQLKKELEDYIAGITENKTYYENGGFDPTVGKLLHVRRGDQYEIQPGIVDVRKYVRDNKIDYDALSDAMFNEIKGRERAPNNTVYVEDMEEVNYTLNNVKKMIGDQSGEDAGFEAREKLWELFEKEYRKFEDSNTQVV